MPRVEDGHARTEKENLRWCIIHNQWYSRREGCKSCHNAKQIEQRRSNYLETVPKLECLPIAPASTNPIKEIKRGSFIKRLLNRLFKKS